MATLTNPPVRGYPDYQRVSNWDSGVIYSRQGVVVAGAVSSAPIDVSRYAYVAGVISTPSSLGGVLFSWYADAAATVQIANRQFAIASVMGNAAQLRIPNMGPFLVVTVQPAGFGTFTLNAELFLTNRYHPCEFICVNPYVLTGTHFVAAGATAEFDPNDYFAGPARIEAHFDTGSYALTVVGRDFAGTLVQYDSSPNITQTPFTYDVLLPAGHWVINALNFSTTAGTLTMAITPSLTGST